MNEPSPEAAVRRSPLVHTLYRWLPGLLLVALALSGCDQLITPPPPPTAFPTTDFPTLPPPVTPTATPAPQPTDPPPSLPETGCCAGILLDSGPYDLPAWPGIPLQIQLSQGWTLVNDPATRLLRLGRGDNGLGQPSQLVLLINATRQGGPEAVAQLFAQAGELTVVSPPEPFGASGFEGVRLDAVAKPNTTYGGNEAAGIAPQVQFLPVLQKFFGPGQTFTTATPQASIRIYALSVGDQTLLLYAEAPADDFETLVADVDFILNSLAPLEPAPEN